MTPPLPPTASVLRQYIPASFISSSHQDYFSNYTLVSETEASKHDELIAYLVQFFQVLDRHMTNEYEVQIRLGSITNDGKAMIRKLNSDYALFQYTTKINSILLPWVTMLLGQPLQMEYVEKLRQVIPSLIVRIESYIVIHQNRILKHRRQTTNELCLQKCKTGPSIHNLTSIEIPPEILLLLGPGLHVVPASPHSPEKICETIVDCLKNASIAYFRSTNGYYPTGAESFSKLDDLLLFLSMKTPCGSPHSEFYYKLRDSYVDKKDSFLKTLVTPENALSPLEISQKFLPDDIVITPTDKNLGVALIPIAWYKIQYDIHCEKGKHEKSEMSEGQCINFLNKKVEDLKNSCSLSQRKLLREAWPNTFNKKSRIGVLKIIPKIHKIKIIDKESWKILPSRPIRGAENCPLNPASKVS